MPRGVYDRSASKPRPKAAVSTRPKASRTLPLDTAKTSVTLVIEVDHFSLADLRSLRSAAAGIGTLKVLAVHNAPADIDLLDPL